MLIRKTQPTRRPDCIGATVAALAFVRCGSLAAVFEVVKAEQAQRTKRVQK